MAQRRGHAAGVRGAAVQAPCFIEVGQGFTGPPGALVGQPGLIESVGFAAPVG